MKVVLNKLTQGKARREANRPWLEEEKGPHLKAYEAALKSESAQIAELEELKDTVTKLKAALKVAEKEIVGEIEAAEKMEFDSRAKRLRTEVLRLMMPPHSPAQLSH